MYIARSAVDLFQTACSRDEFWRFCLKVVGSTVSFVHSYTTAFQNVIKLVPNTNARSNATSRVSEVW